MSSEPRDEVLEALLSEAPVLEDRGFTDQVLARLPPRRAPTRGRAVILLASAAVASLVTLVATGRGAVFVQAGAALEGAGSPLAALPAVALVAVAAWLGWSAVDEARSW